MLTINTDPWAHDLRATQIMRYEAIEKMVEQYLVLSSEKNVYDCACSNNHFLGFLREKSNFKIFGSDINSSAIVDAEKKYPKSKFAVSKLPSVPDFDQRYDVIFALEVLFYLEQPDYVLTLENLMKKLEPTGILFISNTQASFQYTNHNDIINLISESHSVTIEKKNIYLSGALAFEKILLGVLKIGYKLKLIRFEPINGIFETRLEISPKLAPLVSFFIRPVIPIVLHLLSSKVLMTKVNRVLNLIRQFEPSHSVYIIKPK